MDACLFILLSASSITPPPSFNCFKFTNRNNTKPTASSSANQIFHQFTSQN
ncbi:hypothetical protein MKW98_014392, partial [Papaver atlanticum]